ncbi:MAG TPA: VOC family protein [Thermoanaerobaculia bacterium]|nr:VOC family protein [Thermoanaerobaculia bacterium]
MKAVPFFAVSNIEESLRFYAEGLGFATKNQWIDKGKLRWCWLERDGAAVMLQEIPGATGSQPAGITIYFICDDALAIYRELRAKGIDAARPFVGNAMWVTSVQDPDGYRLFFESATDAPQESEYAEP